MTEQELAEYLKENLSIEVVTSSEYTGGMNGMMYVESKRVQLKLNDVIISEAYL